MPKKVTIQVNGREHRGEAFNCRGAFQEVDGSRVYKGEFDGHTKLPHGYGVWEADGSTGSALWVDGENHGHELVRLAKGDVSYSLWDRDHAVHTAIEYKSGSIEFDWKPCDADDARFAELKRAALAVEVAPTPPPRTPHAEQSVRLWQR